MNLVVLAAGMGSRFGGLKQIEPIDKNGNFIADYSIYDAIKAGFKKVIFVIKKENLDLFRQTIGKRIEDQIKVEYVFQDLESFYPKELPFVTREKPWGTAHAILCSKEKVDNDFAIINADDFYGRESFERIYNFLKNKKNEKDFALVGFKVGNTLTENGAVKRGVCKIKDDNILGFTESVIEEISGEIFKKAIGEEKTEKMGRDDLVSMNLFGFTKNLFDFLQKGFEKFIIDNRNDLKTCEYFIPTILTKYVQENQGNIKILDTNEKWYGITYKDDFDAVCKGIKDLVDLGIYPQNLWNNKKEENENGKR